MRDKEAWGGTIQGASGVFNDRLTDEDVSFIKSRLRKIPVVEPQTARAAEQPEIKNLFRIIGSDVLESLKPNLPSICLSRAYVGEFPAVTELGSGGYGTLSR